MQIHKINNYRKFNIKFLGPTNYRGARIKIIEPKRFNYQKDVSVTISYDYGVGDTAQQALNYLIDKGFKPVARCSQYEYDTILCDNWAKDFIELK